MPTPPPLLADLGAGLTWLQAHGQAGPEPRVTAFANPVGEIDGRTVVSFASNNYLGLSHHPAVRAAGQAALLRYGMGTCESRRLGGNLVLLEELEGRLAAFKGTEAAMVFATGLLANVAAIAGIVDAPLFCHRFHGAPPPRRQPVVLYDQRCHRSIQMGIRLAHGRAHPYRHRDAAHLRALLARHAGAPTLIVTDTLFSMDGDLAPLGEIADLAQRHQATLMVDDAHGTGVFGPNGRGVAEYLGVEGGIHLHMGTLSKALGGMGGFLAGPRAVIDFLKYAASGYRFTSSLPAEQAAGAMAALTLVEQEPERRQALWRNVEHLAERLRRQGWPLPTPNTPILPVLTGDPTTTRALTERLQGQGFFCPAVYPPLVPTGQARLRLSVTASHRPEHLEALLQALRP